MKKIYNPLSVLLVTLGAGMAGLLLQRWLLSTTDGRGLVTSGHISTILSFLLLGAFLAVLALYVRQHKPTVGYNKLFADGLIPALGCFSAAAGILYISFTVITVKKDILTWLVLALGILATVSMAMLGLMRLQKKHPSPVFHGIAAAFFAVYLLNQYRSWCKEPQLVVYFFPLLACIFLMLALYHSASLDTQSENCHRYLFFNRAALFCCCMAMCHENLIFFLTTGLYMATTIRLQPVAGSDQKPTA